MARTPSAANLLLFDESVPSHIEHLKMGEYRSKVHVDSIFAID